MIFQANINFLRGVDGHFEGTDPWTKMEDEYKPTMAHLVGKKNFNFEFILHF